MASHRSAYGFACPYIGGELVGTSFWQRHFIKHGCPHRVLQAVPKRSRSKSGRTPKHAKERKRKSAKERKRAQKSARERFRVNIANNQV